jgi:hypothetical protein
MAEGRVGNMWRVPSRVQYSCVPLHECIELNNVRLIAASPGLQ